MPPHTQGQAASGHVQERTQEVLCAAKVYVPQEVQRQEVGCTAQKNEGATRGQNGEEAAKVEGRRNKYRSY